MSRPGRSSTLAALLLLICCCAGPAPAAAAARRMMLQDANATAPALLEAANASSNASSPVASPEPQLEEASPSSNASSPLPSPEAQLEAAVVGASGPAGDHVSVDGDHVSVDDKIKYLVSAYCKQQTGWDCDYAVATTVTSQVAFVDDGFTPVSLSNVRVSDTAFSAFACAYSYAYHRCQLDLSQEVESKVSSTTFDGFSVDTRVGVKAKTSIIIAAEVEVSANFAYSYEAANTTSEADAYKVAASAIFDMHPERPVCIKAKVVMQRATAKATRDVFAIFSGRVSFWMGHPQVGSNANRREMSLASLVQAVAATDAARRWEVMDSDRVRLSATVETLVTGYGKAVVDPREYDKDSAECTRVRYMAATYGEVLPQEPAAGSQSPLVQAVNMYEGEDEFAGPAPPAPERSPSPTPSPSPSNGNASNTQPPLPEGPLPLKTLDTPLQEGSSGQCTPKPTDKTAGGDMLALIRGFIKQIHAFGQAKNGPAYVDDDIYADLAGYTSPSNALRNMAEVEMDGCVETGQSVLPEKSAQLGAKMLCPARDFSYSCKLATSITHKSSVETKNTEKFSIGGQAKLTTGISFFGVAGTSMFVDVKTMYNWGSAETVSTTTSYSAAPSEQAFLTPAQDGTPGNCTVIEVWMEKVKAAGTLGVAAVFPETATVTIKQQAQAGWNHPEFTQVTLKQILDAATARNLPGIHLFRPEFNAAKGRTEYTVRAALPMTVDAAYEAYLQVKTYPAAAKECAYGGLQARPPLMAGAGLPTLEAIPVPL